VADPEREGLKAAADRFATAMRKISRVRTIRTADAVNVSFEGDEAVIAAGHEGGAWGWEPIQALMFDNNKRHPLWGNKAHWYKQGRWPITEYTERAALDSATEAFADAAVPPLLEEHGFTEN
jgi:hypothetical protein